MAEETAERGENAYDWQSLMFLYNAAIKEVRTKLDIMNDEFQYIHQYNPIEYIKSRIKTPNSIAKKLSRHGLENTMENMVEHINDIAGVRIVCSFTSDIYRLAEMIGKQKEFTILYIKDYMNASKGERIPQLSHADHGSDTDHQRDQSDESRDSDQDHCHGFWAAWSIRSITI